MIGQAQLSKLLKAIYSAAIMLGGSLATVLGDDATISHLTQGQWATILVFTLGAFGGTYGLAGWSGPSVGKGGDG